MSASHPVVAVDVAVDATKAAASVRLRALAAIWAVSCLTGLRSKKERS